MRSFSGWSFQQRASSYFVFVSTDDLIIIAVIVDLLAFYAYITTHTLLYMHITLFEK